MFDKYWLLKCFSTFLCLRKLNFLLNPENKINRLQICKIIKSLPYTNCWHWVPKTLTSRLQYQHWIVRYQLLRIASRFSIGNPMPSLPSYGIVIGCHQSPNVPGLKKFSNQFSKLFFCFQLCFLDHQKLFASPPDSSPEVPVPPRRWPDDGGRVSSGPKAVPGSRISPGWRTSSLLRRPPDCYSAPSRPSQVSFDQNRLG